MSAPLEGKTALVTGASRGIGRAIAIALSDAGATVVCTGRDRVALDETVARTGGRGRAEVLDVRDEAAVAALVSGFSPTGLDLLVNNAGINIVKPIGELTRTDWDDVLATNLTGPFLLCRAALPLLAERGGVIVNISSIGGRPGVEKFPGFTAYAASKSGLVGFGEVLAIEARPFGVRVHTICPGSVDTELLAETLPGAGPRLDPAEVARAVLHLAGDAPLATTGSVVDLLPGPR